MRIRAAAVLLATAAPLSVMTAPPATAAPEAETASQPEPREASDAVTDAPPRPRRPARGEDPLDPPRRDPNEAPFMEPRYGGARPDGAREMDPDFSEGLDRRRNVQLTVKPLFASFPIAFVGRRRSLIPALSDRTRGGGAGLDLDIRIRRPFYFRLTGTYSGHPVPNVYRRNDDDMFEQTANRGTFHAAYVGAGVVYALDIGRLIPLVEVGAGVMFLRSPPAAVAGQMGGQCIDDAICDVGLRCNVEQDICQANPIGTVHFGLGVDAMLGKRWSVGVGLRYFAFIAAPAVYPVYLQAAARFGLRF